MADDVNILPSFEPEAKPVATDEVASRHYQWIKPAFGPDGTATPVEDTNAGRLPVGGASLGNPDAAAAATDTETTSLIGLFKRLLQHHTTGLAASGAPADAAAATDTETTGLIGLFKRLLQRLTVLMAQLPTTLNANGGTLKTGSGEAVITQSVAIAATTPAAGADLAGLRNWGIIVPSTFDGTTISFTACDTLGGTYLPVYDITNTPVVMTVAASRYYDVPGELLGIRFLKIVCGTAQATTTTDFLIVGKS